MCHLKWTETQRPHLLPGLSEGDGVPQVMPLDAAPPGPVVGDGSTRSDVFVVQHVAVVTQDAAAGQLAAAPAGPRADHLAVQRHDRGRARVEVRRAPPADRGTRLGGETAVHLPAVSQGRD